MSCGWCTRTSVAAEDLSPAPTWILSCRGSARAESQQLRDLCNLLIAANEAGELVWQICVFAGRRHLSVCRRCARLRERSGSRGPIRWRWHRPQVPCAASAVTYACTVFPSTTRGARQRKQFVLGDKVSLLVAFVERSGSRACGPMRTATPSASNRRSLCLPGDMTRRHVGVGQQHAPTSARAHYGLIRSSEASRFISASSASATGS